MSTTRITGGLVETIMSRLLAEISTLSESLDDSDNKFHLVRVGERIGLERAYWLINDTLRAQQAVTR